MSTNLKSYYDFKNRVRHFRERWERLFQKLLYMGCDFEKARFEIKIINEEEESVEIILPRKFISIFSQELQDRAVKKILENIKKEIQRKVGPNIIRVAGNSVFTAGESGLSYVSHILPIVYDEIYERLKAEWNKLEEDKKNTVLTKRAELRLLVEDLLKKAGIRNAIKRYNVYYDNVTKGYCVRIVTKSVKFRYERHSPQSVFNRYEAIKVLVNNFVSKIRYFGYNQTDSLYRAKIVTDPLRIDVNIGNGANIKKDVYGRIRKILFLLK